MSAKPLVSVIIPLYNAENYVGQTLRSALAQTWPNKEVLVINDGSTDQSLQVARQFEQSNLKVVDQPNQGASAARNHGLRLAQGDYVQFLDADDLLSPNKIEAQLALLGGKDAAAIASCPWGRFYGEQPEKAIFKKESLWENLSPLEFLLRKYNQHQMMQPGVWLCPRSVIEAAGFWDESLSLNDDGEYFSRVVLAASHIYFSLEARVYYRSGNAGSLANSNSPSAYTSWFRSLELCANQLLEREDSPHTRQAVANLMQKFIYDVFPDAQNLQQSAVHWIRQMAAKPTIKHRSTPMVNLLQSFIGWKNARRLHRWLVQTRQTS